jgi:hypothetical protein
MPDYAVRPAGQGRLRELLILSQRQNLEESSVRRRSRRGALRQARRCVGSACFGVQYLRRFERAWRESCQTEFAADYPYFLTATSIARDDVISWKAKVG